MTENPKSLAIAQRIYEEAKIERDYVLTPNKIYFHVCSDPAVISTNGGLNFIVADHMFDSMFLESEVTAYLIASDPELAAWNREFHLSYLEDKMKYFIVAETFASGDESVLIQWLIKRKFIEDAYRYYQEKYDLSKSEIKDLHLTNFGNAYRLCHITEISKNHFDILSKYIIIV